MKFTFFLASALLFCSCQTGGKEDLPPENKPALTESQADIDSVKHLIEGSFQEIWSDLDTARIRAYHTDDFILLEQGLVWNNDSVSRYLLDEQVRMEEGQYQRLNRFDYVKSVQRQNTIWVAYKNYGTWVKGSDTLGTVQWLESAIAIRENNGWKIQQLHSTRMGQ
ncbi:nuclear transport factor 2 family protein [Robiginitalea sp.]|uniref:nuclear transport factor 2 family protein n=1 Tax=Robiginitalea sp. TaxID=1902411 RepID=UPI003C550D83